MLETFYPDRYEKDAYGIPYKRLYEKGYRGVIFDVDNTLVPHGAPADGKAKALFEELRAIGFETCILSNNKEPRVSPFANEVKSPYLFKANKPSKKGYEKAMERMGTSRETTVFVGDQLFTDVLGARRTGIFSILVKPINPKEEIQIVLKRRLEAVVLWFYRRERKKQKGQAEDFVKNS